jgi:hypothetical protein
MRNITVSAAWMALALTSGAQAGGFTVLHSFVGGSTDGAGPFGGVAPAGHGGFYIATDRGGTVNRGTLSLLRFRASAAAIRTAAFPTRA